MSMATDWEAELEDNIEVFESQHDVEIKNEHSTSQVCYSIRIHYITMEIYF
jgi:uncharacterized protein YqgV (UPF0045/DUF77 family)